MIYVLIIIVMILVIIYRLSGNNTKMRERFLIFWVLVPPSYEYVRLRLGKVYKRSLMKEGYNLLIPGIYTVAERVNIKVQDLDLDPEEFWLADQVEGKLKWFIRFKVINSIKYSFIAEDPIKAIKNSAIERAKEALGAITTTDATQSLGVVNAKFEESIDSLNEMAKDFGIEIMAIRAKKIDFKEEYEASLEKIREAENNAKVITTIAEANAKANASKFDPYVSLAEQMKEKGIDNALFSIIAREANISHAVENGSVDTMVMGRGNDLASTIISAKKICDAIDTTTE